MESRSAESAVHVRADRGNWDLENIFWEPCRELLQYRELIRNIVVRDLKVRYKRSVLGIAWTVLAPLLSMLVMWIVFTKAFGVQTPFYAVYLLSGIIIWNFFLQSSSSGCVSVINGSGLIRKIKLPRVVFPISAVVNNLVNLGFAFAALMLVVLFSGAPFHWTLFLVPLEIIPLVLFCAGWAMAAASFGVFFRDIQYILEIFLGAMFYLTPILYEPDKLPAKAQWIVSVNPMAKFIHLFRNVVYYGELPLWRVYFISLGIGAAMFLAGWVVFQRLQRKFVYWL